MTFDALPYSIFRRVAACLNRGEILETSCTDVQRAVLSFCLWERTDAAEGGGLVASSSGGRAEEGGLKHGVGKAAEESGMRVAIHRFLSEHDKESDLRSNGGRDLKTVLASYPRSGNSLLRRLIEEVTGTITGSDTRPDRTLSRSLSVFGMQGEGVVDNRVRVVKTHFPERRGYRQFEGGKVILLVRNPFDAIDSYFNMALTNTHDQSLHDSVYEEFQELWNGMVKNETKVWERFHEYWLSSKAPVHVLRYEDLLTHPEACLRDLMAFMHGMSAQDVQQTYGERIRRARAVVMPEGKTKNACSREGLGGAVSNGSVACDREAEGTGPYRPRSSAGVGGSLRRRFSKAQVAWCVRESGHLLRRFGYDPVSQGFPPVLSGDLLELNSRASTVPATTTGRQDVVGAVESGGDAGGSAGHEDLQVPVRETETVKTVTVNRKAEVTRVREENDTFGRAITAYRRRHTLRDTRPLPRKGEDSKSEEWRRRRKEAKRAAPRNQIE